jgi:hypothetical protein
MSVGQPQAGAVGVQHQRTEPSGERPRMRAWPGCPAGVDGNGVVHGLGLAVLDGSGLSLDLPAGVHRVEERHLEAGGGVPVLPGRGRRRHCEDRDRDHPAVDPELPPSPDHARDAARRAAAGRPPLPVTGLAGSPDRCLLHGEAPLPPPEPTTAEECRMTDQTVPHPTPDPDTPAGFLAARRDFLSVETVDRPGGGWDVVLRIDGTYSPPAEDRTGTVEYFERWLVRVLTAPDLDPRSFGLTAADLHRLADAAYPQGNDRGEAEGGHEAAASLGVLRSRLRSLADALDEVAGGTGASTDA